MNETVLRPIKMNIDIYGTGEYDDKIIPFPSKYINDALYQNILCYSYETTAKVEELAKVPAYYVEELIQR